VIVTVGGVVSVTEVTLSESPGLVDGEFFESPP
jgi:hypothetical protein